MSKIESLYKIYPSWNYDESISKYVCPQELPDDGKTYLWDEDSKSWIESLGDTVDN